MRSTHKPHSELRSRVFDSNGIGESIDKHPALWTIAVAIILASMMAASI